jgi:hypothetical protein
MSKRQPGSRLVYTTDPDPEPGPEPLSQAPAAAFSSATWQTAKLSLDRKGRGGKAVTLVSGRHRENHANGCNSERNSAVQHLTTRYPI